MSTGWPVGTSKQPVSDSRSLLKALPGCFRPFQLNEQGTAVEPLFDGLYAFAFVLTCGEIRKE